jgi:hypothetical protein
MQPHGSADTSPSAVATTTSRLRLTIAHLLVFMLVTAIQFGLHSEDLAQGLKNVRSRSLPQARQVWKARLYTMVIAGEFAVVPFYSVAICSLLLFVRHRFARHALFPQHPGHWLLLALGVFIFAREVWRQSDYDFGLDLGPEFHSVLGQWQYDTYFLLFLLPSIPLGMGIWFCRGQAVWLMCLVVALLGAGLQSIALVLAGEVHFEILEKVEWIGQVGLWLSLALAGVAAARDWRQGVRRDFFHYAGLVVFAAILSHEFIHWQLMRRANTA